MKRAGSSYVATAVALGIITLSGCAAEGPADESLGNESEHKVADREDWGDPVKYPELGGALQALTAFNGTCTYSNGAMVLTAAVNVDQAIIIGKRAVDSAILVNGKTVTGCTTANTTTLKTLKVTATTGAQILVLDFLGGTFAPGIATARGITIDLGAGNDEVRVRGTSAADTWVFGSDGMAINNDAFRDIDFLSNSVEKFSFSLAGGADVFTGTVAAGTVGAGKGVAASATVAFTVFGGDGADTLTGGDKSDYIYGGPGADTLAGGGTGAAGEKDYLIGEQGADVFTQAANNNGPDFIVCGTESDADVQAATKDTVTYALRGTPEARLADTAANLLLTDSERIVLVLTSDCTQTTPGTCDADSNTGYDVYPSSGGQQTEAFVGGALTQAENDVITPDCEIVIGGMDNDRITGSSAVTGSITSAQGLGMLAWTGANNLQGGPGDDVLIGLGGDDVLSGDTGNDYLDETSATGDNGADVLNGGADIDTVSYGTTYAGVNVNRTAGVVVTMDGAEANDGITGEEDNVKGDVENLIGTQAADKLTGNALANVITGGLSADEYDGGDGDDTFNEGAVTSGADVFVGGAGSDTVDYSKRMKPVWVTMAGEVDNDGEVTFTSNLPNLPVRGFAAIANPRVLSAVTLALATTAETNAYSDTPPGSAVGASAEQDKVMEDIENVLGSLVDDDIVGNALDNNIDGGPGADVIFGGAGADILSGGAAVTGTFDETSVTPAIDINLDGDVTDTTATAANDGNDVLVGGEGNDILDGGTSATSTDNLLMCGGGEDIGINEGSAGIREVPGCES